MHGLVTGVLVCSSQVVWCCVVLLDSLEAWFVWFLCLCVLSTFLFSSRELFLLSILHFVFLYFCIYYFFCLPLLPIFFFYHQCFVLYDFVFLLHTLSFFIPSVLSFIFFVFSYVLLIFFFTFAFVFVFVLLFIFCVCVYQLLSFLCRC